MSNYRIKIVRSKGKTYYYYGDGLWFGRISEKKALDGLASKQYVLWVIEDKQEV